MYKVLKTQRNLRFSSIFLTFIVIGLIAGIISFANFLDFKISSIINNWEGKVYRGVTINNQDVSGLSEVALKEFLEKSMIGNLKETSIEFRVNNEKAYISSKLLGLTYDYDKAIEEAFNFSNGFTNLKKINQIFNATEKLNIDLIEKFDVEKNLDILYEELSKKFNVDPIDADISVVNGQVVLSESYSGQVVDKDLLIKIVNGTEPSNAVKNGIEIVTKSVDPKISSSVLEKINGKLSSYTTTFKSSSSERATNVELSANSINGTILMPGESFSFNKIVGPRTRERGYKDAAIIVGNVYESGLGGGICQTSSTLHQAVVRAGIIPTQRRNHSLPTSYMPLGFDAVVAWGSLDYVFKNTYDFPILIDVSTSGRTLTISIYGDITSVDKEYSTVSETYESVPYTTKTIKDNKIANGKQVVEKNGVNGTKVKVYIVTKDKKTGKVLDKKFMWNDYYVPQQKVVRVGTK